MQQRKGYLNWYLRTYYSIIIKLKIYYTYQIMMHIYLVYLKENLERKHELEAKISSTGAGKRKQIL